MSKTPHKKTVVFTLLGTTLDAGRGDARWKRWRPTVCLCQQPHFQVDRLEVLFPRFGMSLARLLEDDLKQVSPETTVRTTQVDQRDAWDFEEVYTTLDDFARTYPFDTDSEDYYVHITTGTHVAQICLFLLTETRRLPAKLIQTSPKRTGDDPSGEIRLIDLDLSKYDTLARRFAREHKDHLTGLKSGIKTKSETFNRLIEEIEHVAARSPDPILLMGPTGAGKSQLARRIFDLRRQLHKLDGPFVEINCATLRGDTASSTLFGHKKGSYTGAISDRPGLLRAADKGILFLDEIGELGLDEQAMLLRALEEKRFLPLGSDEEATSTFQLIAGTNRDLHDRVANGAFREDLLSRINLWTFKLPALKDRREDIDPNLDYELDQFAARTGHTVRFSTEARAAFLSYATSPVAQWPGNFRDLSASIIRMATLSSGGRITVPEVTHEVARLSTIWTSISTRSTDASHDILSEIPNLNLHDIDLFDRAQLAQVCKVCRESSSLSDAGRTLFAASRAKKQSRNDADRLRKYLARFELTFESVRS